MCYYLNVYFQGQKVNVLSLVGALFQNIFQHLVLVSLVVDRMHSAVCLKNFVSLAVILVLSLAFIF